MRAVAHIISAACSILLLQCATPDHNNGENRDFLLREIDDGLGLLLYTDLSLQNIDQYMRDARIIALRLSYEKSSRTGSGCPGEYAGLFSSVISAIGESRYNGVPVIDQASIEWPGALKVRISVNGATVSLPLPAVNPDTWGIFSLRDACSVECPVAVKAFYHGKNCGLNGAYGDHVKAIDGILEKISLERGKLRVLYGRLAIRKKIVEAEMESRTTAPIKAGIERRLEELSGDIGKGSYDEDAVAIKLFEMKQMREELDAIEADAL